MYEGRWVSINGTPTHICFTDEYTYINGTSVQWQNDQDYALMGPPVTGEIPDKRK